jgi:alcohol dehydrogenase YqhD (iron-dependent ADH family)
LETQAEFPQAVGGGSVIDSAKAIGYGVTNEGDVWVSVASVVSYIITEGKVDAENVRKAAGDQAD